jgi:hypothetical protein
MKKRWRRSRDELGKAAEILGDCDKCELIFRAAWSAQAEST